MKKTAGISPKKEVENGFKSFEVDNGFSEDKFGKCPLHYILHGSDERISCYIDFNPNQYWNKSPVEALKSALKQLTGTEDQILAEEIIGRAVSAMPLTQGKEQNTNIIYQSLADIEPKDTFEAKLIAQSTSLYAQGMQYLEKAEKANMMCQAEFYVKYGIKLLRLHNETIESLARYRRKGEQKVVVQHVNINDGGKAIVGNMIT